ncbi:hypothetical protein L1987_55962 [Smallanthus sonchifolius]|uniref:Uncharacterized protein n=1 Tax=Smallanthus sonchifolius TaxID=185202 RepID=A0ACB9EC51_9ASTR|nr:hypothetical protein L1987_55962 [Smallanthus sonchifolius]
MFLYHHLKVNRWVRVSSHLPRLTSSGVRPLPSSGYPKFVKVLIPCKTWSKRTSGQIISRISSHFKKIKDHLPRDEFCL